MTYRPTTTDMQQLLSIIEKLGQGMDSRTLRQSIADEVLRLTRADMLASFAWNDIAQQFEDAAFVNMSSTNLARYQAHFQYCDPITSLLQLRRSATLVSEVMPQMELEKTEFYNDFLRADGLKWGINLYAYDGSLNIGDLRIWRGVTRQPFGEREVALLDMLKPHFTNALVNARCVSALRRKGLNPLNTRPVIDRHWVRQHFALTPKEADMCLWVLRGLSDQAIADQAFLSIWTVRAHVKSIFAKLNVAGRSELTHAITSRIAEIQVVPAH
jgi:DNA-binding CsgD family transcriptional regulator